MKTYSSEQETNQNWEIFLAEQENELHTLLSEYLALYRKGDIERKQNDTQWVCRIYEPMNEIFLSGLKKIGFDIKSISPSSFNVPKQRFGYQKHSGNLVILQLK